jgi:hypothetical protein
MPSQFIEIYAGIPSGNRTDTLYLLASYLNSSLNGSDMNLEATYTIHFTTNFTYTGSRATRLNLYAATIIIDGNISSTSSRLNLQFGGSFNSTTYQGNLLIKAVDSLITTKGGDVIFNGNIGGGENKNLSVDTTTAVNIAGEITHRTNVNGTFPTRTQYQSLIISFPAGPSVPIIFDFIEGTLKVDSITILPTLTVGFIPKQGYIKFLEGIASLTAKDGTNVIITTLSGSLVTLVSNQGYVTIPAGGLDIVKIEYTADDALTDNLVEYTPVDIYNGAPAGKLLNYTAVGGTFTIPVTCSILVNGDIIISTRRFINNSDAAALAAGTGKTWRVWSSNAAPFTGITPDVRGGLIYNFKQYNATYGVAAILGTGNGFLYTYAPGVSFSLVNTLEKVYNANDIATGLTGYYQGNGAVDGDTIEETIRNPNTGVYASKNVGMGILVSVSGITGPISASNGSKQVYGYSLQSTSASGTIGKITPAHITEITGITANDKVYDGTATATLNIDNAVLTGVLPGDNLTIVSSTGTFENADPGTGKQVNITGLSLGGTESSNYTLDNTTALTTATISSGIKSNKFVVNGILYSMIVIGLLQLT